MRIRALTPRLAERVNLQIVGFSPNGDLMDELASDLGAPLTVISQAQSGFLGALLSLVRRDPRCFRRFRGPQIYKAIAEILNSHQPDIVHIDGFAALALVPLVTRLRPQSNIVAHIHDCQSVFQKRFVQDKNMGFLYRILHWIELIKVLRYERSQLDKVKLVLVDSAEDCDVLQKRAKDTLVETLPLGFEPSIYRPEGSKARLKQPSLIFTGSMKGAHSVDGAIFLAKEVMPLVWEYHPDAHLYIVGGGAGSEVRELEGSGVTVTGYVEDLPSYLRASTLYVCSLRLGSGMRTRVVEALACGACMITNSLGIQGLQTPKTSAWMIAETPTEYSEAIRKMLTNPDLISQVSRAASEYAMLNYSWQTVADQLVVYFKEISYDD